jgi:very-short-patch-repair endonuclease
MTPSERRLWAALRARHFAGHKFRRQRPVEGFFADFCCDALKLIVEVDGGVHLGTEQREQDFARESILSDQGFTVLRVTADHVMRDLEGVLESVGVVIEQLKSRESPPHPPTPSPARGEGEPEPDGS